MAALKACKWEPGGNVQDISNTYRESGGAWKAGTGGDIHAYTTSYAPNATGVPANLTGGKGFIIEDYAAAQCEVCFAPKRLISGWDGQTDAGEVEESLVFTRIRAVTIPATSNFEYTWISAGVPEAPGTRRFVGLKFEMFLDDAFEPFSFPPFHAHHAQASPLNYPAVDGLSNFEPFNAISYPVENLLHPNGHLKIGPTAANWHCAPPSSSTADALELCDDFFKLVDRTTRKAYPWYLPAGADLLVTARMENVGAADIVGQVVSMRQYLRSEPVSPGGSPIRPSWNFMWKIDPNTQLAIPPAAGPSFAAVSYPNPRAGVLLDNGGHEHPGVGNELWFIVGPHLSELIPSEFLQYIHEPTRSYSFRVSGDELSVVTSDLGELPPSDMGAMGDIKSIVLEGTGYSMGDLKAHIHAALPVDSLRCIYRSEPEEVIDGVKVSSGIVLDPSTPFVNCSRVHVAEGAFVTIFGLYDNSTQPSYYGMHTSITSDMVFDDDPFLDI
jgi:hypothetical protein